jgi:hypothetical protein
VDGDGLSTATKKWMRTGRAELLSARRCDIVTVANSACRNSATALKPCALSATAKLGVRLSHNPSPHNQCTVLRLSYSLREIEKYKHYIIMAGLCMAKPIFLYFYMTI